MKTEKKSSEAACVPPAVVKEECGNDADHVKIKEENNGSNGGKNAGGNTEETPNEDNECLKDAALDAAAAAAASVESSAIGSGDDNQNGSSSNQTLLNSVKQENDSISNIKELPPDCGSNAGVPGDGTQPMVGNVLAKQMGSGTNTGEAQYMQQQSQIFVFSTQIANKAAELVMQGMFPSIVAYHLSLPNTKKFMEKLPNKMPHYRQNSQLWMNNMKHKGHHPQFGSSIHSFPGEQPVDLPPLNPNDAAYWNDQPNMHNLNGGNPLGNPESSLDDANINVPCLVPNSPNPANSQSVGGAFIGPNMMGGGTTSPGPGGMQTLQGVKIPDENLTPQQRQHREVQMTKLSKISQLLLAEQNFPGGQMDPTQGNPPGICRTGGLPAASGANQCGPGPMDWNKMQHHPFLDGKNKMGVGSPGVPVRGMGGNMIPGPGSGLGNVPGVVPGNGPRSQGPPPPYHQTTRSASVPIAIQSPNPSSPNNPTSNLSLPSPRANSALNSPADCNRQFQLSSGGTATTGPAGGSQRSGGSHLPGQSPTSQDSPNPGAQQQQANTRLNHSNPGTPVSHGQLTALSPSGTPQKDPLSLDFPVNQAPNVEGIFGRSLPSIAQQKQQQMGPGQVKELMPVPSPQQISYMSYDGQELTIQKQPNMSLKDGGSHPPNTQGNSDMGNRMLQGNMDMNASGAGNNSNNNNNNQYVPRSEGASPSIESANRGFGGSLHSPHTPGSVTPHTPVDPAKQSSKTTSAQSSPASHNNSLNDMGMGPPRTIPASPNTKSETSPTSKDLQQQQQQQMQQQQSNMAGGGPGNMMPMMGGPGGNGPFNCGRPTANMGQPNENIPLNPNNIANRLAGHGPMSSNSFDPISSLAQMSQQLASATSNNAMGNDNSPGMLPFNHPQNMHMMQMQQQQQQQQQMNEMNGCMPGPMNEPGDMAGLAMGLGVPTSSYSPRSHPGSPGMPSKMSQQHGMMSQAMMGGPQGPINPNVSQAGGYPSGPGPGMGMGVQDGPPSRLGMPGQMPPQQQQQPGPLPPQHHGPPGPSPYNGANVQVKPGAPNTIQYLPARPNVGPPPRSQPSLDFLQQYVGPNQSLDGKMNAPPPNASLQYYPNGCAPNSGMLGAGPQAPPHAGPGSMPQGMAGGQPPMHQSMRPVAGPPGVRPQPNIMMRQMHHMVGGGVNVFPGNQMDASKGFPPDRMMGAQMPGQSANPGMYGGSESGQAKQPNAMGQLGPPPDTSQPLPPSMGTGPGPGFKSSPFIGASPNMSDPNYAQQFHNFQQQLYATGRGGGPQGHPGMHGQPNAHQHQQQFFMPK